MATSLNFNTSTKKYYGTTSPSATIYAKVYDPSGNLILNKSTTGNAFITASTTSSQYNLPLDTSGNIVQGVYTFEYDTVSGMPSPSTETFTYLGTTQKTLVFNVSNDCNYFPNGQISAVDSTDYGSQTIVDRTIELYYPNGLVPAPVTNPVVTTTASTLVVNQLATGMWTGIITTNLSYTQDDGLIIFYELKDVLNHNVACNAQLCSVNSCLDKITSAYSADIACGSSTPRYANELTLANAYYTQYQIERSCGNTEAADAYAQKIVNLVGQGGCSCGSSCGCSDCSSCDTDIVPQWINNTTSETGYKSYVALLEQSGTSDPVVTVLENSIGDIVWTRLAAGEFNGTLANTFTADKTWCSITVPTDDYSGTIACGRSTDNIVKAFYTDGVGASLTVQVEIRVYY